MRRTASTHTGWIPRRYSAANGTLPSPPFPPTAAINYTRSALLLARWAELAAFSDVIFRSHVGNLPSSSVQVCVVRGWLVRASAMVLVVEEDWLAVDGFVALIDDAGVMNDQHHFP
jgi:hypothetical protein